MKVPVDGYWCEVVASYPDGRKEWVLGGYRANTPRLAVRWLRSQALRLANALDPIPGFGPFLPEVLHPANPHNPNPGHVFRQWSRDLTVQSRNMNDLVSGRPVLVAAGGPDRIFGRYDLDIYFSLTARPMVRNFTAEWKLDEMSYATA